MIFRLIGIYLNSKSHFSIWIHFSYLSHQYDPSIFLLNQIYLNFKYQISHNPFRIQILPFNFLQTISFSLLWKYNYTSITINIYLRTTFSIIIIMLIHHQPNIARHLWDPRRTKMKVLLRLKMDGVENICNGGKFFFYYLICTIL